MKSRAFCCNGELLRRDLTRASLIWGAYLLLWFVALPANILSDSAWRSAMELKGVVLESAAQLCHPINFFYAPIAAWFLFTYLNKSRSANFFGSLPLRRESQFLTHYLAGILCGLVPNFLISGLTMLFGTLCGANLVLESAVWFAAHTLAYLFYFNFAVLCAMLVGHLVAMPPLYAVLNFAAVVLEAMVQELAEALIYGIQTDGKLHLAWLSPLYHFSLSGHGPDCVTLRNEAVITGYKFTGWTGLLILAGVGVIFAVLAYFCYKHRRMEAAGDVMAIRHLKPVFLYVVTFGSILVIGTLLSSLLVRRMDTSHFGAIALCLLVSAVLGFFLGQMMLEKSLRVFGRRNLRRCLTVCALTALVLLGCRLDVLGVAHYVPAAEDVAGVEIDSCGNFVTDPQRIRETVELHTEFVTRQKQTERLMRQKDTWMPSLTITYRMVDGKDVTRSYRIPVQEAAALDETSLVRKTEVLLNTPEVIIAREMPDDYENRRIINCIVYYPTSASDGSRKQLDPSIAQTKELLLGPMITDMRAGNMGMTYYTAEYRKELPEQTQVGVEIQMSAKDWDGHEYHYFTIQETASNTIAALQELGVPEKAFTYREGVK